MHALTLSCFPSVPAEPRYRPSPSPGQRPLFAAAWLALNSCNQGVLCVLGFALPRYRPRYITVTYLVTDPTTAPARDPLPLCRLACVEYSCTQAGVAEERFAYLRLSSCSALHCATETDTCQEMFSRYKDLYPQINSHIFQSRSLWKTSTSNNLGVSFFGDTPANWCCFLLASFKT